MSNSVTVFDPASNIPAYLRNAEVSALGKIFAGGGGFAGKRISIKGGVFRLFAEGKEVAAIDERFLDVVMVNAAPKIGRTFYAKVYDDSTPAAPNCWSADGDKPDATASSPQASTCAACPQNVKGSGQGDSRACRFSQRVAVVLANDIEGDVMQLSLPATSIFGKAEGGNRPLQDYARYLLAQGVDPTKLITRLRFDTNVATPKLFFKAMRWLTKEEADICLEQGASPEALQAVTMTVAAMDGTKAPAPAALPAPTPAAPAPAAAKPALDDEPPAPAPKPRGRPPKAQPSDNDGEPTVRAGKPAAPPVATTNSLSSALAQWDDEA